MITNFFLKALIDSEAFVLNPLLQDGSTRQYYRVFFPEKKETFILMELKDPQEILTFKKYQYDWVLLNNFLKEYHIPCPNIISLMPDDGILLIEDLGDLDLSVLFEQNPVEWEKKIIESFCFIEKFLDIPRVGTSPWLTRSFDIEKLQAELLFFHKNFLDEILGVYFSEKDKVSLLKDILDLSVFLSGFSKYFVHRDFHSRNLLIFNDKTYVIDFQDARLGHPAYDLVSLCFDSYISLDQSKRLFLIENFLHSASIKDSTRAEIEHSWPAMLLQRQLKALGSFGFLTKNRPRNYLSYVPKVLESLSIPEVKDLGRWPFLIKTLVPMCQEFCFEKKDLFFGS